MPRFNTTQESFVKLTTVLFYILVLFFDHTPISALQEIAEVSAVPLVC